MTVPTEMVAVCSGELKETVLSADHSEKTFHYALSTPTSAGNIGLAIGHFDISVALPLRINHLHLCIICLNWPGAPGNERADVLLPVRTQALAHPHHRHAGQDMRILRRAPLLQVSLALRSPEPVGREREWELRFPLASYKTVFVAEWEEEVGSYSGLSLLPASALFHARLIDPVMETRRMLAGAMAAHFFGAFLCPLNWAHAWLIQGLARCPVPFPVYPYQIHLNVCLPIAMSRGSTCKRRSGTTSTSTRFAACTPRFRLMHVASSV